MSYTDQINYIEAHPSTPKIPIKKTSWDQCIQITVVLIFKLCITELVQGQGTARSWTESRKKHQFNQDLLSDKLNTQLPPEIFLFRRPKENKPILSSELVDEIEKFVCLSFDDYEISFLELAMRLFQGFGVSDLVSQSELRNRGHTKCIPQAKTALSACDKWTCNQCAKDHLRWTKEDWNKMRWTDESWITNSWYMCT